MVVWWNKHFPCIYLELSGWNKHFKSSKRMFQVPGISTLFLDSRHFESGPFTRPWNNPKQPSKRVRIMHQWPSDLQFMSIKHALSSILPNQNRQKTQHAFFTLFGRDDFVVPEITKQWNGARTSQAATLNNHILIDGNGKRHRFVHFQLIWNHSKSEARRLWTGVIIWHQPNLMHHSKGKSFKSTINLLLVWFPPK